MISLRAFRLFFACAAAVAAREAAGRVALRARNGRSSQVPRYQVEEVARLAECTSLRVVRSELRRLESIGLLKFTRQSLVLSDLPIPAAESLLERVSPERSHTRAVPVPRPVLRLLARPGAASTSRVVLAHCLRGLIVDRSTGEVRGRGTVKASWIAQCFRMSLRSVRSGRAELVRLGLITRDLGSSQRKLNRDGAYFSWNLGWSGASCSAPLPIATAPSPAPPIRRPGTPYGSKKDQEPIRPGAFKKPDIREVVEADLKSLSRLDDLFQQAVRRSILDGTESDALNFICAAVRARAVKCKDPARVFMGIVRRRLWNHVTQGQEDRAREGLAKFRGSRPDAFRPTTTTATPRTRWGPPAGPPMDWGDVRSCVERSLGIAA